MKSLLVLRHGKSDWHGAGSPTNDHDRPLKPRGQRSARLMGRYLSASDNEPDLVLTSSAVRAHSTAELAAEAGGWNCRMEVLDALYGASPGEVLDIVRAQSNPERLLVVGHEPTLSELVAELVGGIGLRFPTAALARIDFVGDAWAEVGPRMGTLQWLVVPRALAAFAGEE